MTANADPSSPEDCDAAIAAVTRAYDLATKTIEALEDPDLAFRLATELWAALRAATDANGQLRARLASRIWREHELDLVTLAKRLSQDGHPIGKSRAGQLLQAAKAADAPRKEPS